MLETWIATHSGKKLNPFNPNPDDITIGDIAHSLSMMCRFNGHCSRFYSVAEHSILVSQVVKIVSREAAMYGLMHDAAEAYLSDIPKPIKRRLPEAMEIENVLLNAILAKFKITVTQDIIQEVEKADLRMLETERIALIHDSIQFDCTRGIQPYSHSHLSIKSLTTYIEPHKVELAFLVRFKQLGGDLT